MNRITRTGTACLAAALGLGLGSGTLPLTASAQESAASASASPAEALAAAYGFEHWSRIDRVDFTFHVELPGGETVDRVWSWAPNGRDGGAVTLNRGTPDELSFDASVEPEEGTDLFAAKRNFVNDTYWLTFPFQLLWSDPTVLEVGEASMPISGRPATKLMAAWPAEGGYTPADVYELYLGESGRIAEWAFRRGGGAEARPATWENERTAAGVTFATEHHGPEGAGFTLSFPSLEVWADGAEAPEVLRGGE
ncbi:hypothetical protein [Phycisphaera mikurensis]|uniref:Uncharacterized protein n=1 Tax=Phycisphaera mikurensis (strain NBRC 102666 / KCTC 22515 / FYK2301M01) TaxID=1142394 RepID=I0IIS8_PHYMF|nr:hypothetical protein [Phycisphaera mikurensis]MBB6442687.1 hypothetical protein [Phycisphaera mikurensis]BAM05166.1 hypothetical protein PSMK_30070 [Phycisphaera mikurensis NBRC 102666]